MLPVLEFYANHTLDFENTDIHKLEYDAISELRTIEIPADILNMVLDSIRLQFPGGDLSIFTAIENWCPLSPPNIKSLPEIAKEHIVSLGPMGLRFVIRPDYIILPAIIYEPVDWYSPLNKEKVQIIRSYYHTVISLFGGDHALYVDTDILNKYFPSKKKSDNAALISFEQSLVKRYGTPEKNLYEYPHGEYPKYYIDHFTDIKN